MSSATLQAAALLPPKPKPDTAVVVVDTDPAWRREVKRALGHAGYEVVEATSALDGLVKASSVFAPVVATHYPMLLPGGSPLARVLTSAPELAGAVVVATVSESRSENIVVAAADGCHAVVVQPAPATALVKAVELALGARG